MDKNTRTTPKVIIEWEGSEDFVEFLDDMLKISETEKYKE